MTGLSAQSIFQGELPNDPEGFIYNISTHFRLSNLAVFKNDWNFADLIAAHPRVMRHFNLKSVSVGLDFFKLIGGKKCAPEAFETSRGIGKWHAGYELHIYTCSSAEHEAERGQFIIRMPPI